MTRRRIALILIACCVAGAVIYAAIAEYGVARSLREQTLQMRLLRVEALSKLFSYGIVQSSQPEAGVLTFVSLNRPITVHIDANTLIRKEMLVAGESGTYESISDLTPGTIADLMPGTKVAVSFSKVGEVLYASEVLFGQPL